MRGGFGEGESWLEPVVVKLNSWPGQNQGKQSLWMRCMLKLRDLKCSCPVGKTAHIQMLST